MESRGSGQPKNPEVDVSATPSRQETEGSLEMETAFSNQGFEGNDETDSSLAWSPEVRKKYFYIRVCMGLVNKGCFCMYYLRTS